MLSISRFLLSNRQTNKAINDQTGHPPVADKVVVLDAHAFNDNRISKHIGSVHTSYPVLRLNFNFYADRKIISPDPGKEWVFNVGGLRNPYLNGMLFTVHNMLGYSKGIEKMLRQEFLEKGDNVIFHVHDPYVLGLAHRLKRKFPNSRIVYDRHEYFDTWRNRLGLSSPGLLEKKYARSVDEIVFVSRRIDSLPEVLKGKRTSVIPNYPQRFRFDQRTAEEKIAGLDNSDRVELIYFGVLNLDFDRDIRLMFRVMDSLMTSNPMVDFTVAGRLDHEGVRPLLDALVDKHGERVRYLGEIQYEEVIRRTQKAHLGFFLLRTDSPMWSDEHPVSPNKIYEYLLSGTIPIVRAALDDLDTIKSCAITFDKNSNFEDIRESVAQLISDKVRMRALMTECLITGQMFSWESVSPLYLECYRRLFDSLV